MQVPFLGAEEQGDKFWCLLCLSYFLPVDLPEVILLSSCGCSFSKFENIYLISYQLLQIDLITLASI